VGRIELSLGRIQDLFDPFDPFPLPTRDLSGGAEAFIVAWARELPHGCPLSIILHVRDADGADRSDVARAISAHFAMAVRRMEADLAELFRVGRLSLLIGAVVLLACSLGGYLASRLIAPGALGEFLREGLLILGWVANWRPIEIFLYDWWPVRRKIILLRRIAGADVDVRLADGAR
jgi:hypothetical protein